jgi:L-aspartate oxidase
MVFAGSVPGDCNSWWAQGGIIYRNYDPKSGDSAESLANDIHRAGAGLCDDYAVRKVSEEGPDRVKELLLNAKEAFADVPFDQTPDGELSLCLEASHAAPRILHYADHTGAIITDHITKAAAKHPLINMQPNTLVTDIVREDDICIGVATLDRTTGERNIEYATRGIVLASGGLGGIYEHSTNPSGFNALGSSVALAQRAGVQTQDMEYVQFHPTSLCIPNEARFLLTEALRGEGAVLRDANGRAFAKDFHPDGELAPRDIVARGVFAENAKTLEDGVHNAYLDISHRDRDWLHSRFPTIHSHLSGRGLDLAQDHLPVTPAAHYTCGGVTTDLHGRTSLDGLYAAGEAARTGLHGGNRLASTSLLEGLVFGASVADFIGGTEEGGALREMASLRMEKQSTSSPFEKSLQSHDAKQKESVANRAFQLLGQVRRVMWDHVGLVRTPAGLSTAIEALGDIQAEANELHDICPSLETVGVRDAVCAGEGVALASAANHQSAGTHYIVPNPDEYSDDEDEAISAAR